MMSQFALRGLRAGSTTEVAAPDAVQVRELQPVHCEYLQVRSKRVPELNSLKPKCPLFIKLGQRLLAHASLIGAHTVKSLG